MSQTTLMAGYIMPRGKAAKRARSRSRSRSRVDRSLASALQAQTRAPEADDSVEVKVCGGLSSALHVSFYHVPLSALRPTQPTVGIGAVQAKVEKMEKVRNILMRRVIFFVLSPLRHPEIPPYFIQL